MALTRLDNLISSKTGKYLYVSPDDFNATDEINNRGNSPIRPFRSIQRAFLEISRFSYQPGPDNDRFDQFTVMVMPGKHYVDNRPGLATADGIDAFQFDQALNEWIDNSNLDIGDPNNCLYKFNNTEGGAIIPRGSSIIGYDLRRTSVHPLFVPDPADRLEPRSAIFNVTGGCYFWQFTIRDGDLEPASPLYDNTDGIGKVYYQNGDWTAKAVPNFSHHKLTVFEYADKEELGLYYQKVAKAFSQYQPTIDDPGEFGDRIQETRIVGPLSDIRSVETIKLTDSSPAGTINVEVTSKVNHGYFKNQFVAIENNGLDEQLNGVFTISEIDLVDQRKFSYNIPGTVAALGTSTSLISGTTYTTSNGLDSNAVVKAEVDSVESASPYVFNCSIRSTWGICGIWANGLKATGFKSMVIAQYTGVSLQKDDRAFIRYDEYSNTFNQASLADAFATVPYHTKGDAYWKDDWRNFHVRASDDAFIQCVSIFAVGFADHFLMESGGDMSITNSNSNFGNTSLHAIGHKGFAFAQDKGGYITDIVPPQVVDTTTGNIKKNAYYTIDIPATKNLNSASDQTKIYLGDDEGYNPETRVAASIDGFRIGARSDEKLYVKLIPRSAGSSNIFSATLSPNGFKKFNATASILNPTGITINNKDLDAADLIEANKEFIAYEAYGFITNKYPYLLDKEGITITKCRRDIGYLLDAAIQDLRLGGNINTIQAAESYYVGNNLSYITGELTETLEGYNYAKDLAIASIRNWTYLRTGGETTAGSAIVDIGDTSGVVQGMTIADYDPSQFTDNKLNVGATRPASPVIPDNTFVKRVVSSTEIELGQKATFSTKKVLSDRNGDARNLLLSNKLFIAAEAFDRMVLDFPTYTSPTGYGPQDCRDDLVDIVEAIAENTAYGGNDEVWDAAYHYDSGAVQYISQKKEETIRAIEYARDMSIQIMRNEKSFIFGSHGLTQTYDNTVTYEPPEVVNDRNGDARNLILANKQLIAAESVERMLIRSSTAEYTPTDAEYDPATGDLTLDIASHGLLGPTSITASDATYNPETGWLTVTSNSHGLAAGSKIKIEDDSLTLTCSMDGNATTHSYPRSTDPISDKWIDVVEADTNTFSVDVGKSLLIGHDVTGATFAPASGLLTVTIPDHNLREGQNVRVSDSAFTFTCAQDNHATQHVYPRSTDPAYQSSVKIVSDGSKHTVTGAGYNPDKGTIEFTLASHGFSDGDKIRLDDDSLVFTCAMDSNATEHSYPRKSDPISGKWITITNTSTNTFEAHVGTTPSVAYDLTNANYDPVSGQLTVSIDGNHDIDVGESIRFADDSLTFTCGMDGNGSNKTYPRTSDPAYNTGLEVIGVGGDFDISNVNYNPSTGVLDITVPNHGLSNGELIKIAKESLTFTCGMDNNATEHVYPRATDPYFGDWLSVYDVATNSFKVQIADAGPNVEFSPTDASYNPATGDLELTVGAHNMSVGDGIVMDDGALSFTCTMDGNQVAQSYPRANLDKASGRSLPITAVDTGKFTINVGSAGVNKDFTPTNAIYNENNGDMVLTLGQHGLRVGTDIVLKDNSLTFTCDKDGGATQHSYPRPGTDPYAGKSIAVTAVGSTQHTATDIAYTPSSGVMVVTVASHGFSPGDYIQVADNSITLTCELDGNVSQKTYPRTNFDSLSNRWVEILSATTDTFTINVGSSTDNSVHTFVSASANGILKQDGTLTINVGFDADPANRYAHTFVSALTDAVEYKPQSAHTFVSALTNSVKHLPQSAHTFKRAKNYAISKRGGDITVNVGKSPIVEFTPTGANYDPNTGLMELTIGSHSLTAGTSIKLKPDSLTFTCAEDGNATQHTYPRSTDPFYDTAIEITAATATTITVQVLASQPSTNATAHTFVSATAGAVETGGNYLHTFVSATAGALITGGNYAHIFVSAVTDGLTRYNDTVTLDVGTSSNTTAHTFISAIPDAITTGGNYTHSFIDANPNGIKKANDRVRIDYGALTFTCDMDNHGSPHAYPRVSDPAYQEDLPVLASSTNQITVNIGKTSQGNLDVRDADYNPATGDLVLTVGQHHLEPGQDVKIIGNSIKFTCNKDNNATEHAYPRPTDPAGTSSLVVKDVGSTYHSSTDASYDPATGDLTLVVANHGFADGDRIKIADGSLTFTCDMDNNATEHAYPRLKDPSNGKWLYVDVLTSDTIKVNVGQAGASQSYTPTGVDYQPATGNLILTIPNHNIPVGKNITIAKNSLKLRCTMGDTSEIKTYPRATDPIFDTGTGATVTSVSGDEVVINVGASPLVTHTPTGASYDPLTGLMTLIIGSHTLEVGESVKLSDGAVTFTCAQDNNATNHAYPRTTIDSHNISDASYNPTTGVLTLTDSGHGIKQGDWVKVADNSLTFTCAQDSNATNHTYPRSSDPISNKWVKVLDVTTDTFDILVLDFAPSTNTTTHAFVSATAGAVTQKRDKSYDSPVNITAVAADSITLDVGKSSDTTVHAFVSALADSVTSGGNYTHTFISADYGAVIADITENKFTPTGANYDAASGDLTLTIGSHNLAIGDGITIDDNSLTFKCQMDEEQSNKVYPRPNHDFVSSRSVKILGRTSNTITVNVGGAGDNETWTPSAADYNSTTGDMILTIGQHGLREGAGIVLKDNSLTFTCSKDNNTSNHSYPRPGIDPYSGDKSITITNVGATLHSAAGAGYIPETGVLSVTVNNHGFTEGDYIQIVDGSLVMTCDLDGNVSSKTYPRQGFDYPSGRWLKIQNVTTNAFDVNVGISSDTTNHTFVSAVSNGIKRQNGTITVNIGASPVTNYTPTSASYNASSGDLVLEIGVHDLQNGEKIRLATDSLTFTCTKDSNATNHTYPRVTDPAYNTDLVIKDATTTTITIDVGIGAIADQYDHTFVSATTDAVIYDQRYTHTFVSSTTNAVHFEPQSPHTFVSAVADSIKHYPTANHTFVRSSSNNIEKESGTFTVNVGASAANDQYPHLFTTASAGAVQTGGAYFHKFVSAVTDSVHKVFTIAGNQQYHNQDCIDDVVDLLEAIGDNLAYGGNDKTWDAAYSYKTGAHVAGEETETNYVFEQAREMSAQALRNQKILVTGDHGLHQVFDKSITYDEPTPPIDRFGDARNLVVANKLLIGDEAYARMLVQHPGFVPPTGNPQDCKDDIIDFVEEVSYNLAYGGNDRVWEMTDLYVQGAHVAGEETQTVEALNHARDLMIQIARNEDIVTLGSHGRTQVKDTSITVNTAAHVSNRHADAKDLILANVDFAAEIALGRMIAQYPSYSWQSGYSSADCLDDLKDVVKVVAHNTGYGGNHRVWDAANLYVAGAHAAGSEAETAFAFNAVRDIIKEVATNVDVTVGGHTSLAQVKDTTITDGVSNGDCAVVLSAIDTLVAILTGTIANPASLQSVTRTDSNGPCEDMRSAVGVLTKIVTDALADPTTLESVVKTASVGSCEDVRSTLNSLFKIVIDTVQTPTTLDSVTRTISNGACQEVASTITTLYQIITGTINSTSYLDSIERNPVPLGLEFGPSINANATSTNSYLYFDFVVGVYTDLTRTVDDTITQHTTYPQCVDQANAIRQYFSNITTVIQTGLGSVPRQEPSQLSTALSSRATIWTLSVGNVANPHDLETGTPIRLVPRPRYDTNTNSYVDVDKRFVRLPNGFETNREYYVIAPARTTQPENYGVSSTFNGTDQTKIMLASSKENAAAGIYLHSAEVEDIHPDVEIDLYQFVLDDNYDLHQYGCVLDGVSNTNIRTDVPHIFDVPFSNTPGHTVFFRKREGGSLPLVGAAYASDTTVADANGRLLNNKYFFARYQTEKVFTIHKTKSDAEQGVNPITYQPGIYDFNVFANKRESPMMFDPTYVNPNTTPIIYGKWYIQVENDNGTDQIIKRLREYADGIDKTNDSWFERIKDERPANDRLYRLRYVVPQYLKSVRDPLNGFTIKTRTDETRRLVPQKLVLKPVSGNVTKARFSNPVQSNEYIGYTKADFINFSLNDEVAYDPYKKDLVANTQFAKVVTTQNYISMTIQSGRYITQGSDDYLELTVFEQGVTNPALTNTKFTTVKITAPQGGSFVANKTQSVVGNRIDWAGNSTGYGYLHAIMQVPGTATWHMILKDTVGKIDYDSIDNIRFSQGTAFADLLADPDFGKSLVLKDLIKKGYPEFYYRQNGAGVYTITPGDIIEDDASIQYYVESVEDVGQIDDNFYIFNTQEIQKRIYGQQDGIYYLTAVRGNISPLPQGAGNLGNFRNFKFSQPISKLYPLNYKNDPLWYQQLDATLVDPPQTYSAADNYVHGLVRVNDFKGSLTQESVIDLVNNNAFGTNTYTQVSSSVDNRIRAQKGNAASGSEDRLIPIVGDSTVLTDQRYYVELRRPSIARAGNHTFEYLGFGPGNYSTGLPARQEVVLTEIQDFYAQSKKQDGGLVFYTGLNSNGDLYIGNRKIDAITGEEVFLESASLVDSDDDDESLGNLVTTFDTPVTFNEYITVNGGEAQDKRSTFNSPVLVNVLGTVRNSPALVISSFVDPAIDDGSLDRSAFVRNVETGGDIVIARNKISAAIFQFNSRRDGQAYKIQTHVVGAVPSNITPDQTGAFNASQIVQYGNAGTPLSGDFLLKGESIGKTGSLGWIYSNYYTLIGNAVPESFAFNNTNIITIKWTSLTNQQLGITSSSEIKISGFTDSDFNGTWQVISNGFNPAADSLQIAIGSTKNTVNNQNPRMWSDEVAANSNVSIEYSNSNWKEWGVIGAEALRTETDAIGDYKLGINTVGRSDKASFETNFVDAKTTPRANLDVVGTAFISGKKITDYASHNTDATRTYQDRTDAFMVGGDSASPTDEATLRVSTANGGRVGVNVTDAELDRALVVDGTSRFTDDAKFEEDIEINGGGGANTAQVRTTITTGTIEFFPSLFVGTLDFAPTAGTVHVANDSTADQFIRVGNASLHSNIWIGATPDTSTNISKIEIGGAYNNNESLSFTLIGTKSFKTKGDFQLGTDRGLLDTVKLSSTAGTVEFFSGSSATSKLDFATNAAEITIAGKGGTTTIRNNLVVDSTARFNSDITLCGGFASYSFTADRAQIGTTPFNHASGDLGNNIFNSNVDLIDVLRVVSTDENYNAIDTSGSGDWGGTVFQNTITAIAGTVEPLNLPALTGEQFYLPLKNRPYDSAGVQYFSENDILIIDTDDTGNKHPEFVKVISLPRINVAPYYIVVERLPFGTYTAKRSDHSDTTAIYKCIVQFNATWTTTTLDDTGTEENVYLAQFGGSIAIGDYVIIDREDTTADGIFDQGELFKVKTLLSQVAKKLTIKNGCDTANEEIVFEVDSTTGNTTMGSGGTTIINGQLNLNGTCTTPYTNSTTNKKLTISDGSGITTFEVDTCTGDTNIGNHHGTVFMLSEQFGTTPSAYTKDVDEVHVYRHNPMSVISGGPASTTSAAITSATSNIEIQGNLTSFLKGDMIALYTTSSIEIIRVTDDPYTGSGGEFILPTASNAEYVNGGRGIEGTSAIAFSIGTNLVKLDKYERTTTLLHDMAATQADRATALKARSPNNSDIRLEISLRDADLIAPKLDYITLVRIGSEFFLPDSVDGTLDAFYAIKMPKQIREPNLVGTTPVQLFGGGTTTINQDLEVISGAVRMYGSDGKTLVMSISNDDGHSGDGSLEDPKTDTAGLTLKGPGAFYGDLKVYYDDCQMFGLCNTETTFRVTNKEGNILMGETFYQAGKVLALESAIDPIFHIDNLGTAGVGGTEGPKDFKIYQNNAIDSFGIEKYWTAGGGRRHTYVAFDPTTGLGQQIDNPLQVNQNYLVNASSGSNMVVYLPENAQTGDMIRFIELSGNLTYNTSLIIRAKKINNIATNIQGDGAGSRIDAGAGQTLNTAWDSGELIIQTRNASFGLVYAGTVDVEGSPSAQTIPPALRGWWLIEL